MPRTPTDSSGEPLEVLTLRVSTRHIKLLDLLAYGMTFKSGKRVGRGQALRNVMGPIFDAMEKDEDVKQAMEAAKELAKKAILDAPEHLRQQANKAVEKRVGKWMDALDVKE